MLDDAKQTMCTKALIASFILPFCQGTSRAHLASEWKITCWRENSHTKGMTMQFEFCLFTYFIYPVKERKKKKRQTLKVSQILRGYQGHVFHFPQASLSPQIK